MTQSSGKDKKGRKKTWTGAEKLRVLTEAAGLSESDLGALLRREGLHETQLAEWRLSAEAALGAMARGRTKLSSEAKTAVQAAARIKELEREVRRKDKALAETAALLVLKKKVQEIWGNSSEDEDDTTDRRHGR